MIDVLQAKLHHSILIPSEYSPPFTQDQFLILTIPQHREKLSFKGCLLDSWRPKCHPGFDPNADQFLILTIAEH